MGRRVLVGVLFGVVVYAGIVLWIDLEAFRAALAGFPLVLVPVACGLSLANYLIRFVKWERYRLLLGVRIPRPTSFLIYLAGFAMGVTPGKMGEVLKSWMIRRVDGTRIHRTAPIVVAERVTDLLGYLVLVALGGLASRPGLRELFVLMLALVVAAALCLGSERFARAATRVVARTPFARRLAPRVEGSFESTRLLLAPREIVLPTLLSVVSWGCECVGFWLVASAFVEGDVDFLFAVFAYAFSAVVGAFVVFLPGGLGVTEWSLGALLRREYEAVAGFTTEVARSKAVGAILVTRLCTLWFAVGVGVLATALFERRYGHVDMTESPADDDGELE